MTDNKEDSKQKQLIEKLYELRVTQNTDPMHILQAYKDYGNPGFF